MTDLTKLAKDLHLTARQRRFAEAYAADPDRNASEAARAAGYPAGAANRRGSENVSNRDIQQYIAALTEKAAAAAGAALVADVQEVLVGLTCQARSEEPWQFKKRQITTLSGELADLVEEDYRPGEARSRLLEYYEPKGQGAPQTNVNVLQILAAELSPEQIRTIASKFLSGGDEPRKAETPPSGPTLHRVKKLDG